VIKERFPSRRMRLRREGARKENRIDQMVTRSTTVNFIGE
jgi:hypothetical protein